MNRFFIPLSVALAFCVLLLLGSCSSPRTDKADETLSGEPTEKRVYVSGAAEETMVRLAGKTFTLIEGEFLSVKQKGKQDGKSEKPENTDYISTITVNSDGTVGFIFKNGPYKDVDTKSEYYYLAGENYETDPNDWYFVFFTEDDSDITAAVGSDDVITISWYPLENEDDYFIGTYFSENMFENSSETNN